MSELSKAAESAAALLSICMMLMAMVIANELFSLVTLVAFSPLFGYFFATVGRTDAEIAVDGAFYVQLLINALWCFVFAWVLGRVVLGLLDVASLIYKKRRNETEQ